LACPSLEKRGKGKGDVIDTDRTGDNQVGEKTGVGDFSTDATPKREEAGDSPRKGCFDERTSSI